MATNSNYHIQKPYVLATLPRTLAQSDSKSVVGEVYGQKLGDKKKRRSEVVVGIGGEAANLYDITSARLITSYPVPPQAKFSCPPCSLRLRSGAGKKADVARYTYIATRDPARKLSLFKDSVSASGATTSTTASASLGRLSTTIFLGTLTNHISSSTRSNKSQDAGGSLIAPDLLVVNQDGDIAALDGETLKEKHRVSIATLSQDLLPRGSEVKVELAQTALAADVVRGLQLDANYLSAFSFSQKISVDGRDGGFNPDVLLLITSTQDRKADKAATATRYLHVLVIDPGHQKEAQTSSTVARRFVQVHHVRLPSHGGAAAATTATKKSTSPLLFRLDVASGSLFALDGETVLSYDLARSVPRITSRMAVPGITSFLRLSKSSILTATSDSFSVYNPVFSSLQASTSTHDVVPRGGKETAAAKAPAAALAAYFPQLELAVALVDANLIAIQLEPPRVRSKKRRADGLLIDSIGRGVSASGSASAKRSGGNVLSSPSFSRPDISYIPGTMSAAYAKQYRADVELADQLLEDGDVAAFDEFLAKKLGIQDSEEWRWQRPLDAADGAQAVNEEQADTVMVNASLSNGVGEGGEGEKQEEEEEEEALAKSALEGTAGATRTPYPEADRRWVIYAIGHTLRVQKLQPGSNSSRLLLDCTLPESAMINYLVDAGHLTAGNVRSALRGSLEGADAAASHIDLDVDGADAFIGEALPGVLAQIDPSLDLLLRWLYATKLSATELLSSILLLMRSLELVDEPPQAGGAEAEAKQLLPNGMGSSMEVEGEGGSAHDEAKNDARNDVELDRLDQQVRVVEYFLEHVENDPRDLALDMAIGKLGSCPALATVRSLRRLFRTDEIRALIELLRKQLVDQGWATRYLDMGEDGQEGAAGEGNSSGGGSKGGDAAATPLNYSIRLIADLLCRCIDAVRPSEWLINDAAEEAAEAAEAAAAAAATAGEGGDPILAVGGGGGFFTSLRWQVSAALEGVQEALYLHGIVGEAMRYGSSVQAAQARLATVKGKTATRKPPTRIGTDEADVAMMLPLGLKPTNGSSPHNEKLMTIKLGGEVARRTPRELGHVIGKNTGAYTLERIVL